MSKKRGLWSKFGVYDPLFFQE